MTCYDEQIEQAEADLGKLLEEEKALKSTLNVCRETVVKCESRLRELRSAFFRDGEIERQKGTIESLKRKKAHMAARKVVWKLNNYIRDDTCVVTRVTAQRVYFSRFGSSSERFVDKVTGKDGRGNYCNVMDIEATFPEGVENYRGHD
jgi:hypothetical protein